MSAGSLNLYCEQGASWVRNITIESDATPAVPMNLTGYTARAQVRETPGGPLIVAISCSIVDAAAGKIQMTLTPAQTAAIPAPGRDCSQLATYAYDLEIESAGGVVMRILNGMFRVSPEATR